MPYYLYKNLKTGGTKMTDKITKHIYTSGLYDYKYIYSNVEDIPFENRSYDIIFACYNWRRNLKNVDLINRIIKDSRFDELKIAVAGNGVNLVKKNEKFNVITLPCLDNRELLSYFNNSRSTISNEATLKAGIPSLCNSSTASKSNGDDNKCNSLFFAYLINSLCHSLGISIDFIKLNGSIESFENLGVFLEYNFSALNV